MPTKLLLKKINPDAILPTYAKEGDSGMDLYAVHDAILEAGNPQLVATGWQLASLPKGYELQIRPRSGNALKGNYTVANAPGTVDSGYRGPIGVILVSFNKQVLVKKGDRIAQMVLCLVSEAQIAEGEVCESKRGEGGFGSTGR